jgi:hypothetical protein
MRLPHHEVLFFAGVSSLFVFTSCREKSPPPEPALLSSPLKAPDEQELLPMAIEIHRAAQEMALDGFQYGKNDLGWPFDSGDTSSADYFRKLIRNGFLAPEFSSLVSRWQIANLSDADPGETVFLGVEQPDGTRLFVRKDGKWASFSNEDAAKEFFKVPPRKPAWLP